MYKYLDHTADILVEAQGQDFSHALQETAKAMFNVIGEADPKLQFNISSSATSKKNLVVSFLSDILSEMEIKEVVFNNVEIQVIEQSKEKDKWVIKAIAYGDSVRPKDHIKAVTYHMLNVEEKDNNCIITVLFDV